MTDPSKLLAEYVRNGSDAAFRELVSRYVDFVHSAAFRMVENDAHRAQDVTQTVFVDLARMARTLHRDVKLGGWLHRHTCFVAANVMRGERRRLTREKQAYEMNTLQDQSEADYSLVAPLLDEAINTLGETDRAAIQLRFFERHEFRDVGRALGSSEDAARMRVARALEKLESFLKRRGVTSTAAGLGVTLSANAVQAAPAGLAASISTAALASTTSLTAATAIKTLAMTTLQKSAVVATLAMAGTWLGIQYHTLASVEKTNLRYSQQIAAAQSGSIAVATSGSKSATSANASKGKGTMDWKYIAAQLAINQKSHSMGDVRALMQFNQKVQGMTKEELVAALDEIAALDLPADSRGLLEGALIGPLIRKDPEFALTRFIDRIKDPRNMIGWELGGAMAKWARKDPAKAAAWLDQQIAAGKLDSKSLDGKSEARIHLEGKLIYPLLGSDPNAAALRLSSMPEDQRGAVLLNDSYQDLNEKNDAAFAKLAREVVPQKDQPLLFARCASGIVANGSYAKCTEFLDRIAATPAERSACAEQATIDRIVHVSEHEKVTRQIMDSAREWVGSQAPDALGRITGKVLDMTVLSQGHTNFSEAADLAVQYDKIAGNNEVLTNLLDGMGAQSNKEEARVLAQQISDPKTREKILNRLE